MPGNRIKRLDILAEAWEHKGKPYIYGGNGPLYFDCSGVVCFVYRPYGLVPAFDCSSQMLWQFFTGREVKLNGVVYAPADGIDCRTDKLQPANIIFFGKRDNAHHVGIIVDHTWMLEAARGNSSTRTLGRAIAQNAKIDLSQISRRGDRLGIVNPYLKGVQDGTVS